MLGAVCVVMLAVRQASFLEISLINSTTYQSQTSTIDTSRLAIDGNTKTCSVAEQEPSSKHPWWRVKLDRFYNITGLSINFANKDFMNNLNVYVSKDSKNFEEQLCISFQGPDQTLYSGQIQLKCVEPKSGQFVTIKRIGGIRKTLLVLCEVLLNADKKTVNLAFKRPTVPSGLLFETRSAYTVDNNLTTCAVIAAYEEPVAWMLVMLDRSYYITNVNAYFMPNVSGQSDYRHIVIYISNDYRYNEEYKCGYSLFENNEIYNENVEFITCEKPTLGLYVTVKKHGIRKKWLILCELEIFSKNDPIVTGPEVSKECLAHEYKCHEGRCIHKDWLCDGTDDCPSGDDEPPSCRLCEGDKFKCARRNECIAKVQRCDGFGDCPDISDEQECFIVNLGLDSEILKATYEGDSYYVCSQNWKLEYSHDVCRQHGRFHLATEYHELNLTSDKVLSIVHRVDHLPGMHSFSPGFSCQPKSYVKIQCDKQKTSSLCGTRANESPSDNYGKYIINGENAKPGAWPWHVQIFHYGEHICGGSIISEQWILTAAHCLENVAISYLFVKVGSVILNDPHERKIYASLIINHPEYAPKSFYEENDVALIKLESPIVYTKFVRPICLPQGILDDTKLMSFRHCVMTGFGHIDRKDFRPEHLQQGRMNLMTNLDCGKELSRQAGLKSSSLYTGSLNQHKIICAGSLPSANGINNCRGDSGGALVCKDENGIWIQVGVAKSFMKFDTNMICSNNLFHRVDHYSDTIYRAMEKGSSSSIMEGTQKKIIKETLIFVMHIMIFKITS